MSFTFPGRLLLLIVPALLVALYVVAQLRRPKYTVKFTNLALLDTVVSKRPSWRRHLPAVATLIGLASLVFAMARPTAHVTKPVDRSTVMLAIDVSVSMMADDVAPTRMEGAKQAATTFVEKAPKGMRIGLISFAGSANVEVAPTLDREALVSAITRLELRERTAIGEAVFTALDTLEEQRRLDAASNGESPASADGSDSGSPSGADGSTPTTAPTTTTLAPGQKTPEVIILMSDGTTTVGRPNDEAAQAAKDAGIPVDTVAYGTSSGTIDYQGEVVEVPVDGPALKDIADATGGSYFEAKSGAELTRVFEDIGTRAARESAVRDVSMWFVAIGGALVVLAALGSIAWFSRIP